MRNFKKMCDNFLRKLINKLGFVIIQFAAIAANCIIIIFFEIEFK